MSPDQIIFLCVAAATLVTSILVVTSRALIHAALWLIAALFGIGVMYVLLNASFFAVAQVLIYIGAIAILFIFAVMLTRGIMKDMGPQNNPGAWLVGLFSLALFGGLVYMFTQWNAFSATMPSLSSETTDLQTLGSALVSPNAYLLPFELASVLLVTAMIGSIYISLSKKQADRP